MIIGARLQGGPLALVSRYNKHLENGNCQSFASGSEICCYDPTKSPKPAMNGVAEP